MLDTTRLRELRTMRKISQAKVAEDLNISREAYSMYETGRRQPSYEMLVSLATYFKVSLDYLTGLTDVPDSFASLNDKALYISRSLPKLDKHTIDYIASVAKYTLDVQDLRSRAVRFAESVSYMEHPTATPARGPEEADGEE